MKLIVVDPRFTKTAEMADLWLQIRPGTDAALMLGWLKIVVDEGLYDKDFIEKWTVGFDRLKERIAAYTPERVSEITWIPREKIFESARIYAATKPATLTWGLGCDKQGINLSNVARARSILRAITGNLDVKGGDIIGLSEPLGNAISDVEMELNEMLPSAQRRKQLGGDKYRLFSYPGWERASEAARKVPATYAKPPTAGMTTQANPRTIWQASIEGKPYPVKGMIVLAGNPLMSLASTRHVYDGLKHLELLVVMEYYMNPTAELADYVLPAASTLERSDIATGGPRVVACPKAIEPLYERRSDYEFWRELGLRLGQDEYWPWKTAEEVCDYRLKPLGITFDELVEKYEIFAPHEDRQYEKYGFATPSGKVELYSTTLEELGYDPLPSYIEPPETPVSAPKIKQKARLTDAVDPRMVHLQHGWWFPEKPAEDPGLYGLWESNANVLCTDDPEYCSKEIGAWPDTATLCKVYRAT